jgi:hypothetical protein
MRKTSKLVMLTATALAGLAFAGSALASYGPKLTVSSTDVGGDTWIGVVVPNTDDPTAKVSMYVPASYTVATASPGKLGDVTATAAAADLGGAVLPLTGELDAVTPDATTAVAAQACGVTPAQTWNLKLTAAGQTLNIPMFVVANAGPELSLGTTKLVVCLPPPDVPVGTPGRAAFGAKLLSATFTVSAIKEPTATGDIRWTSLWTPYTPAAGTPNAAGSVEVQAIRHLPQVVTFKVSRKRIVAHKTIKVNGKKKIVTVIKTQVKWQTPVSENGQPPSSATVAVVYKGKRIGGATGSITLVGVKTAKLTMVALVDGDTGSVPTGQPASVDDLYYHDLGATSCTASPIFQGLPCVDATVGGEIFVASLTVKAYTK